MLLNQISTKDLFSTNPGSILGNKYEFSDSAINSSTQSNSQLLNSQLEYSQLSSGDGFSQQMSNVSQTHGSPVKSYYQRYMAKGPLFAPKDNPPSSSQESLSHHKQNSFTEQIKLNKQKVKEREERDLLCSIITAVKECGQEVKESVGEIKAIINEAALSDKKSVQKHLEKFQESLVKQQDEFCDLLKTREDERNKMAGLHKQLAVRDSQISELRARLVELEGERTERIVTELKRAYAEQHQLICHQMGSMNADHKHHANSLYEKQSTLLGQHSSLLKAESEKQQMAFDQLNHQLQERLDGVENESHLEHLQLREFWQSQLEKLQCHQRQELQNLVLKQVENLHKNQDSIEVQRLHELHVKHKKEICSLISRQLEMQSLQPQTAQQTAERQPHVDSIHNHDNQDLHHQSGRAAEKQPALNQMYSCDKQYEQQQQVQQTHAYIYSHENQQYPDQVLQSHQGKSNLLYDESCMGHTRDASQFDLTYAGERERVKRRVSDHVSYSNHGLLRHDVTTESVGGDDAGMTSHFESRDMNIDLPYMNKIEKWTTYGNSAMRHSTEPDRSVYSSELGINKNDEKSNWKGLSVIDNQSLSAKSRESRNKNVTLFPKYINHHENMRNGKKTSAQDRNLVYPKTYSLNSPTPLLSPNPQKPLYTSKSLFSKNSNPSPIATVIPQIQQVKPIQMEARLEHKSVYDIENLDNDFDHHEQDENENVDRLSGKKGVATKRKGKRQAKSKGPVSQRKRKIADTKVEEAQHDKKNNNKPTEKLVSPRRSGRLAETEVRSLRSGARIPVDDATNEQRASRNMTASHKEQRNAPKRASGRSQAAASKHNTPGSINAHAPEPEMNFRLDSRRSNSYLDLSQIPSVPVKNSLRRYGSVQELSLDNSRQCNYSYVKDHNEWKHELMSPALSSLTEVVIKRRLKKTSENTFATPDVTADIPVNDTPRQIESVKEFRDNTLCRRDLKKRKLCEDAITSSQLWAIAKTTKK